MKKFILILTTIAILSSCQQEETAIENQLATFDLFSQSPKSSLDTSQKGLYYGIFSTFDTKLHGKILINVGNDGNYNADVKLLNGERLKFLANNKSLSHLNFVGDRGSFTIEVLDNTKVEATNFMVDNKEGYVRAYKGTSRGIPVIAFGTYVDSSDPAFTGNWDMVNNSGATAPGVPFINLTIEDIIISHPGGFVLGDEDLLIYEPVFCVFASPVPYFVNEGATFKYINAQNQQSTFNGVVTNWGLFRGLNGTTLSYLDGACQSATSGTWSRLDRSGTITVTDFGM